MDKRALVAASGLGISGIGGITAFTVDYLFKDKSVKGILARKGIKLISHRLDGNNQMDQWKAEFKIHEDEVKSIIGYNGSDLKQGASSLKKWCEGISVKEPSNQKDLENAEKFCSMKSMKDQIQKLGKNYLDEKSSDEDWNKTFQKRQKTNLNRVNLDREKAWCKEESKKDFLAFQITSSFKYFYLSCTKEGSNLEDTVEFTIENIKTIV
ncbi:hypothetical protein HF1_13300 [Mycoplasma haemofelis str. Langford 1]|uniref:Uncharacterized protein n=1 Tax=Mycoplasma haemofelis (strain Langford 1) TaxID=941640 RepID=E8ZJL7_MYCHL|nr:hypothetical protein [Mycoplasma haemofelis]CBY93338.1 hypothetical protein HF1_13300 [Mycoplasma haemofelis str. Langford 1]